MKKTRTLLAVAVAIAGLVAVAGPAQAAPPPRPGPFAFDLPGTDMAGDNGFCSFPVHIEGVNKQQEKKTTGPNGEVVQRFNGNLSATVTGNGKTLTFNASGPGTTTTFPDGSFTLDNRGPNLLVTTVGNSFPGVPPLNYTTGHVQVAVAASGLTTSFELKGRSTDVCAALSS